MYLANPGIIEKSAIDGQKTYHQDLVAGMRGYIKEHPSEFGHSEDEPCEIIEAKGAPTEAERYAAEAKRKRHEDDLGYIQGGLDKVSSGLGSIGAGVAAVLRASSDMAMSGTTKEMIFTAIILILVVSNIYTYVAFQPTVARRQARKDDISEAVRLLLVQTQNTQDAQGLLNVLDNVEIRVGDLRRAIETIRI